jgi:hypothetical protein
MGQPKRNVPPKSVIEKYIGLIPEPPLIHRNVKDVEGKKKKHVTTKRSISSGD